MLADSGCSASSRRARSGLDLCQSEYVRQARWTKISSSGFDASGTGRRIPDKWCDLDEMTLERGPARKPVGAGDRKLRLGERDVRGLAKPFGFFAEVFER